MPRRGHSCPKEHKKVGFPRNTLEVCFLCHAASEPGMMYLITLEWDKTQLFFKRHLKAELSFLSMRSGFGLVSWFVFKKLT